MYAEVVFPAKFRNPFTYIIPPALSDSVQVGIRVLVPFGKRLQTGFVINITNKPSVTENLKEVIDTLDSQQIFDENSLKFYNWLSDYYLSSLGEALRNCVPYGTEVETKRKVIADPDYCNQLLETERKDTIRYKIIKLLADKPVLKVSAIQKIIKKKSIYSVLNKLQEDGIISILNDLESGKVGVKTIKHVELAIDEAELFEIFPEVEKKSQKQLMVLLELMGNRDKSLPMKELTDKLSLSASPIKTLEKNGIIKIVDKEVERIYTEEYTEVKEEVTLTEDQQKVVSSVTPCITGQQFNVSLLHGVTGSGKTQVYIELVKKVLEQERNALVLVPEISLTPQITTRFINYFGDKVAVFHSRLSLGERYDTWRKIIKGDIRIVIGPRSALFAPLRKVGLIIVDEEHDQSYKQQELVPRFNARDAAIMRGMMEKCPVLLGSATPSIESMYNAINGKYTLLELPNRVDGASLPVIKLVDISQERKQKRMENIFSRELLKEIGIRLEKKEGVILLQNRRGFATQIYCEDCGEIEMCGDCSVPMVFHIDKNILQCHYCASIKKAPKTCSHCGSHNLKYFGTGTQRVEDELSYYYPDVVIERVDSDAISKKGQLSQIYNDFNSGKINVLVGTQMVSKGLDFSGVTLVGVISAETSLWLPDFRADERTFQLLTQVAGRAGRKKEKGLVLIQTQDPGHPVLRKVLENNYKGFYENEIISRELHSYPPYSKLCLIEVKDEDEKTTREAATDFYHYLNSFNKGLIVNPPNPAIIEKVKTYYRYQILIKSEKNFDISGKYLREVVLHSFLEFRQKSRYRDVRLSIDVDPQSVI